MVIQPARVYFQCLLRCTPMLPCATSWQVTSFGRRRIASTTAVAVGSYNKQVSLITGTVPCGGIDISAGQIAESRRVFTQSDCDTFGRITGDSNPLHQPQSKYDDDFLSDHHHPLARQDGKPVVHGMLVASLFSHIFGTLIPGVVYRKQTLNFRRPVHVEDAVVGRVEVVNVRKTRGGRQMVRCTTRVVLENTDEVCVDGEAEVVLDPPPP